MDTAYQGFATGDVEDDAWAVRDMVRKGWCLLNLFEWSWTLQWYLLSLHVFLLQ